MKRIVKVGIAAVTLPVGLFAGGAAAFGQSTPGGAVQVWGTTGNGGGGTVLLTGAVGDSGKASSVNASGTADKKGAYKLLTLKKGTILLNGTQLNAATNDPNTPPTSMNSTNCSATFVATEPVPVVSGTKAYAGISGSVNITVSFAFIEPMKNGKCNFNANPIAQYGSIAGSGTVSFS
jgi:hypothetical protein